MCLRSCARAPWARGRAGSAEIRTKGLGLAHRAGQPLTPLLSCCHVRPPPPPPPRSRGIRHYGELFAVEEPSGKWHLYLHDTEAPGFAVAGRSSTHAVRGMTLANKIWRGFLQAATAAAVGMAAAKLCAGSSGDKTEPEPCESEFSDMKSFDKVRSPRAALPGRAARVVLIERLCLPGLRSPRAGASWPLPSLPWHFSTCLSSR